MTRLYTKHDYPLLSQWWKDREWPVIPEDCLSSLGFIVNDMCAGFLYSTDSKICLIEFIISDPHSDKDKRNESLNELLVKLEDTAKDLGFHTVFTTSNNKNLIKRLQDNDYNITDTDATHFLKRIN